MSESDVLEQAAAVIAAQSPHWTPDPEPGTFGDLRRAVNAECLKAGRQYAQALADAGLLPTEQAWGVRHPDVALVLTRDTDDAPISSKEHAMVAAREGFTTPATVVTRRLTTWQEVDESGAEPS